MFIEYLVAKQLGSIAYNTDPDRYRTVGDK